MCLRGIVMFEEVVKMTLKDEGSANPFTHRTNRLKLPTNGPPLSSSQNTTPHQPPRRTGMRSPRPATPQLNSQTLHEGTGQTSSTNVQC